MCRELHERFMPHGLGSRNKINRTSITFLLGVIHTFYPQVAPSFFHSLRFCTEIARGCARASRAASKSTRIEARIGFRKAGLIGRLKDPIEGPLAQSPPRGRTDAPPRLCVARSTTFCHVIVAAAGGEERQGRTPDNTGSRANPMAERPRPRIVTVQGRRAFVADAHPWPRDRARREAPEANR
jgi:hypothetical protein